MKIRTDFVTNSSSYSSSEIMIDNPVLLEILQRYKDLGAFGEDEWGFEIGSGEFQEQWSPPEVPYVVPEEKKGFSKTPAVYDWLEEGAWVEAPTSLDEMIEKIIELIGKEKIFDGTDGELISNLKEELLQRKDEITRAFTKIYWEYSNDTNQHEYHIDGRVDHIWTFTYDSKNGEKCKFVAKNPATDEILEER